MATEQGNNVVGWIVSHIDWLPVLWPFFHPTVNFIVGGILPLLGISFWVTFAVLRRRGMRQLGRYYDNIERAAANEEVPMQTFPLLAPPYRYRRLLSPRHIRILTLQPGHLEDPIVCSLKEAVIDDCQGSFEAISYRWGERERSIFCEGSVVAVSRNLYEALKRLRYLAETRDLWADAVCINQTDDVEKLVQVPLMVEIYTVCSRCLVWLGWHTREDALAFKLISQLYPITYDHTRSRERENVNSENAGSRSIVAKVRRTLQRQYSAFVLSLLKPDGGLPFFTLTTPSQWSAFSSLLENEWFERVWTLQEVVLPHEVLIVRGQFEIPVEEFFTVIDWIDNNRFRVFLHSTGIGYFQCLKVSDMRNQQHWTNDVLNRDLFDVLRNVRERDAGWAQDKVIGALGLCPSVKLEELGIKNGQTARLTYTNTALHLLNNSQKPLRLLLAAGGTDLLLKGDNTRLPSWIPNWDNRQVLSRPMRYFEATPRFCAGGSHPPYVTMLSSRPEGLTDLLYLQAKIVVPLSSSFLAYDSVESKQDYAARFPHPRSLLRKFAKIITSSTEFRASGDWFSETWQAYIGEFFLVNGVSLRPFPSPLQHYLATCINKISEHFSDFSDSQSIKTLWRFLTCERDLSLLGPVMDHEKPRTKVISSILARHEFLLPELADYAAFFEDLETWVRERKFYLSEDGTPGWVPLDTQEGDLVCVLQGCDLPMVLRPGEQEHAYTVIGHCYLDGIMHGEAMDNEHLDLQEICII